MGWASGSVLMDKVLTATMSHIPKAKREAVVKKLIQAFQDEDCDTLDECSNKWPLVGKALRKLDPELYQEDW